MANRRDVLKCCAAASLTGIAPLSKAVEGKTLSSIMFEPCVAGGLSLKGRVIRSSVLEYAYEADGYADRLLTLYRPMCGPDGEGVSAIISGMIGVNPGARAVPRMIKAYDNIFEREISKVSRELHAKGTRYIVQLAHCGQSGMSEDGVCVAGPSEARKSNGEKVEAMSAKQIAGTIRAFGEAAKRAQNAGADAVEIHCAHGFLLSEFMSPAFNRRTDEYGGSFKNRSRLPLAVFDEVRAQVGQDFPIWVKINSTDRLENGVSSKDFLALCEAFDRRGAAALHISGGLLGGPAVSFSPAIEENPQKGFFEDAAHAVAKRVKHASIISVGGYRTPAMIERTLAEGDTSLVSLGRPLTSEPDLVSRWAHGDRCKARCISCNRCFGSKNIITCVAFAETMKKGEAE